MVRAFRVAVATALLVWVNTCVADSGAIATLDGQYAQGRYIEAMVQLHKMQTLDADVSGWLAEKAQSGVPPFQYEYSRRVVSTDMAAAIRWFARGFVVRSLDFAECADRERAPNPGHIVIANLYSSLFDRVLAQPSLYASEAEQAIEWEQQRAQRPPSTWICENRVLPDGAKQAARERQSAELRAGIARLKARSSSK